VFEVSSGSAPNTAPATSDTVVANRYGFGGGFYRQYAFGPKENGRFRWAINAFWQRYAYGPSSFGQISGAFNEWRTELTDDFAGLNKGDDVAIEFFRENSFWGVSPEMSIGF
jgi:hypothetical protein